MERLLVFLLATVVGSSCLGRRPMDLSGDCSNNLKVNYFLTRGMGHADGLSVYIGNFNKNCTVNVYTNKMDNTTVQIIVVEAATDVEWVGFCKNSFITIKISDKRKVINPCEQSDLPDGKVLFASVLDSHKTVLKVRGNSSEMLKVTATSGRKMVETEGCSSGEIECVVTNRPLCINVDLLCDGNINCGSYGVFDEDTAKCHSGNYKRHIALIISGLLLLTIALLIIAKLCRDCLPRTPKHFFQPDNLEDNKLIFSSHAHKEPAKIPTAERKRASGDTLERIEEKEIRTLYYEKPPKKRLTTNSPVYRNPRVTTIILDDIKSVQGGFVSETDLPDSQSGVYDLKIYGNRRSKRNKRRHTISDFI